MSIFRDNRQDMKLNRILAVVAVCASAAASFSIAGAQVPGVQDSIVFSGRAGRIVADILYPASGKIFVTAHRGDWRNYPENSLPAIESVIRMGGGYRGTRCQDDQGQHPGALPRQESRPHH